MSAYIIKNLESIDVKADPIFALGQLLENMKLIQTRDSSKNEGDYSDLLPFPEEELNKGFYHSSRHSEAIARGYKQTYVKVVREAQNKAQAIVETAEQQAAFDEANRELQSQYIQKMKSLAGSRSGVYSGFMAGRSKLNTKQVARRGDAYDTVASSVENWINNIAPNFIYNAVRMARNGEQIQKEIDEKRAKLDARMDKDALYLWELLGGTLPVEWGGATVKSINFQRDGLPSAITTTEVGTNPLKLSSLYARSPYSLEDLINRLKAKGFDVPTSAAQMKKTTVKAPASEKPVSSPDDIEMTMDEWKKVHRDFKGRIDGQRTVVHQGRIRGVKIVKPAKFDSIGGFDSAGSEVDYTSLAAFNGLNESKVQSDPVKALELCLSVMPINAARQFIAPAQFNAKDYADKFSDPTVTVEKILQNFPPDTADKMQTIIEDLKGITATDIIFKRPDGTYKPERESLHENILYDGVMKNDEYMEPIIPNGFSLRKYLPKKGGQPVFIILGGRGGSGKSSFNGTVYNPPACLVLDADSIKERLPEYQGWNAAEVHEESGDLLDDALKATRRMGINVVLDATMKTAKSALKNIEDFKKAGYRIEAHYMFLPRQEAAKRAVGRFLNPDGGRFVPIDIILKNTTNEDAFEQVKPLVDKWSFRDNNVPRGSKPILISSSD